MKMWLCPATTVSLAALMLISSGIASILKQNQSFYFLSLNIQAKLSLNYVYIQKLKKKSNVWIWRSSLLLYQTLLCTTALYSPQWQKTLYTNLVYRIASALHKTALATIQKLLQNTSNINTEVTWGLFEDHRDTSYVWNNRTWVSIMRDMKLTPISVTLMSISIKTPLNDGKY